MISFITTHPIWFVIICLVVLGILFFASLLYYGFSNPPSKEEREKVLPGDDLLGNEKNHLRATLGISINAPREVVWPYLAQIGQRRAGFYSFAWLERLLGFHIYNTLTVVDEWQNMYVGEFIFYHQCGIGSEVKEVKPGYFFATLSDSRHPTKCQGAFNLIPPLGLKFFAWSWNFILEDSIPGNTRFLMRCDAAFEPYDVFHRNLVAIILGIPSFIMGKGMLRMIKACAEGKTIKGDGSWLRTFQAK